MTISRRLYRYLVVLSTFAVILKIILVLRSPPVAYYLSHFFSESVSSLGRLLRSPLVPEGRVMLGAALVLALIRLRRKHQAVFKATRLSHNPTAVTSGESEENAPHSPLIESTDAIQPGHYG